MPVERILVEVHPDHFPAAVPAYRLYFFRYPISLHVLSGDALTATKAYPAYVGLGHHLATLRAYFYTPFLALLYAKYIYDILTVVEIVLKQRRQ